MSVTSEEKLLSKLENSKAYREAYVSEHVKTSVPLQIRHLREQRELTQTQLAEQAKTTQTVISRLEDPNYGNLTLNSLLKIASALDIGLLVKFVPFSRLLLEFQDLSPKALSVKSFAEELAMLKEWAGRAKRTISSPIIDDSVIKPAAIYAVTSAEVEQWSKIQAQLLKPQLSYQSHTDKVTAFNSIISIYDVKEISNNPSSISRDITTSTVGQTIKCVVIGQGRSLRKPDFE